MEFLYSAHSTFRDGCVAEHSCPVQTTGGEPRVGLSTTTGEQDGLGDGRTIWNPRCLTAVPRNT